MIQHVTLRHSSFILAGCLAALVSQPAAAQTVVGPKGSVPPAARAWASHVIIPQHRAFASHAGARPVVTLTGVTAGVVILEQVATTTLNIQLSNPSNQRLEAELLVPVPDGAVVRGFDFHGAASEPTATLLPRDEARQTYDAIVAKVRDPALLEFAGYNLIRSSVFPVEPHGSQTVRLTYEHLLPADGDRVDYVLPRSENVSQQIPWEISVRIKAARPIATVYSPSHTIETAKASDNTLSARVAVSAQTDPGSFRLSHLKQKEAGVSASFFAYPDAKVQGGYFLLLASLPPADRAKALRREVTIVLDRSGSMNGEKIEQAREAVLQVLAGLEPGEMFNIITYNEGLDLFSPQPLAKSDQSMTRARAYVQGIQARGGTNIHDALVEALRPKPAPETLPIVLFLTDGLATVGHTAEIDIRNAVIQGNPHQRRIFTFGVGYDVNTPLLEKIATVSRAAATFVLPKENVEVKVSSVFQRLKGPVLSDPQLAALGPAHETARVREILPRKLNDLFDGDQVVVLGQYRGDKPLTFTLAGNYLGQPRQFEFKFDVNKATTKNAFVPRLWASRKIGELVDSIRQSGASDAPASRAAIAHQPPKELVDEIVRLSTEFGILTEYTAFLAREGTDLSKRDAVLAEANRNFHSRAINTRSGEGSVNQELNGQVQKNQLSLNYGNWHYDEHMNRVSVAAVQQVNDRTFYRRGARWVDSSVLEQEATLVPTRQIEFGSTEFKKLVERLTSEGRQGSVSLAGDIVLVLDGQPVLVKAPKVEP